MESRLRIQPPLRAPAACRVREFSHFAISADLISGQIYVISMEFLCVNRRRLSPPNVAGGRSGERRLHSQAMWNHGCLSTCSFPGVFAIWNKGFSHPAGLKGFSRSNKSVHLRSHYISTFSQNGDDKNTKSCN